MTSSNTYSPSLDSGGSFFGGLLVLFGVAALLMQYGMMPSIALWKLWPLIFVWKGLLSTTEPRKRIGGLSWLVLGAAAQAYYLDYLPLEWRVLWPALAIVAGLRIMSGAIARRRWTTRHHIEHSGTHEHMDQSENLSLQVDLVLGGREDKLEGREFAGGRVSCTLAGYELDLRGAHMVGDEAVLHCDITMGGVELRVPRSWRVEVDSSPILGGIENNTQCSEPEAKRLLVRGHVVMGGLEIRN